MPRYGLLCNIDPSKVSALNTANDKLCVGVPITGSSGETNPVVASVTDIKEGTILSWSDVITVFVKDADDKKSSGYDINFGQTLEVKNGAYTVTDDPASPRYGFRFRTDVGGSLEVHQKFTATADKTFTTQWYDAGTQDITWDLYFNVWYQSKSSDKFLVKYSNTTTQIIYCDMDGGWSLASPHLFAAGTIVAISQGHGGYFLTQPHSSKAGDGTNLKAPPVGGSSTRKAISVSFGPLVLEGYVDIATLEVGVDVSILGIELGVLYGNLKDGVVLHVNLIAVSGLVRLYLQHPASGGTQLWLSTNLEINIGVKVSFVKEMQILSW